MSNPNNEFFDVIVIGGGAAGLSAALWCDELALSCLLLERQAETGGQLLWTYNPIKNHLGIEAANGRELRDAFLRQTEGRAFLLHLKAEAVALELPEKRVVLSDRREFRARAVVIATGVRRRKLNVPGEDRFSGRGIIDSGKRNAPAVAGQNVVIVGGGDAAAENALILAETAARVRLVHRRSEFRARTEFLEKIKNHPKIEIFPATAVRKIEGASRLERLELENLASGETEFLPTDALLIRIGVEPNTEIFRGVLDLDDDGYLIVNQNCETSAPGVYAVGDAANPVAPTVSSAVGMGATAAKAIFNWLNS